MAKQTKTAAVIATELVTAAAARRTTDKTYDELPLHAEIVVEVGPRIRSQNNKVIVVEDVREVIFTKAGYEMMDRNEEGETTHTPTNVVGIPSYQDVDDPTVAGGKRKDMVTLYFADADDSDAEAATPNEGAEA